MPKRPMKLSIRIPEYQTPHNAWRKAIHRVLLEQQRTALVQYEPTDRLEVNVRLYFPYVRATELYDVDNRLKDCMDALQGRVGGTKTKAGRRLPPIVPNDRQIWRVVVEKQLAPKNSHGLGHLTIRKLSGR